MTEETPLERALRIAREADSKAVKSTKNSSENKYKDMTYEEYVAQRDSAIVKKKSSPISSTGSPIGSKSSEVLPIQTNPQSVNPLAGGSTLNDVLSEADRNAITQKVNEQGKPFNPSPANPLAGGYTLQDLLSKSERDQIVEQSSNDASEIGFRQVDASKPIKQVINTINIDDQPEFGTRIEKRQKEIEAGASYKNLFAHALQEIPKSVYKTVNDAIQTRINRISPEKKESQTPKTDRGLAESYFDSVFGLFDKVSTVDVAKNLNPAMLSLNQLSDDIVSSNVSAEQKAESVKALNEMKGAVQGRIDMMNKYQADNPVPENVFTNTVKGISGMLPDLAVASLGGSGTAAENLLGRTVSKLTQNAPEVISRYAPKAATLIQEAATAPFTKVMAVKGALAGGAENSENPNLGIITGALKGEAEGMYMHGLGVAAGKVSPYIAKVIGEAGAPSQISTAIANPLANAGVFAGAKAIRTPIEEGRLATADELSHELAMGVGFSLLHAGQQYKTQSEANSFYENVLKTDTQQALGRIINETPEVVRQSYNPELNVAKLTEARDEIRKAIIREPDLNVKRELGNEALKIQNQLDSKETVDGIIQNKDSLLQIIEQLPDLTIAEKQEYVNRITELHKEFSPIEQQKTVLNDAVVDASTKVDDLADRLANATTPQEVAAIKAEAEKAGQQGIDASQILNETAKSELNPPLEQETQLPSSPTDVLTNLRDVLTNNVENERTKVNDYSSNRSPINRAVDFVTNRKFDADLKRFESELESLNNNPVDFLRKKVSDFEAGKLNENDFATSNIENIKKTLEYYENIERSNPSIPQPDSGPITETPGKLKTNLADGIVNLKVNDIVTDESRFQNRDALSEERIKDISDNFDANKFDPIVVFKDANGKNIVLSGHHRFEVAKRRGIEDIPAKLFEGTEQDAINFAKDSNTLSKQETATERAKRYNDLRESGVAENELYEMIRLAHGKDAKFIQNLSRLDLSGKALETIKQFESSTEKDTKNKIQAIGDWIGQVKAKHFDISRRQENEMFDYLMDSYSTKKGSGKITNKNQFFDLADALINRLKEKSGFNENSVINFKNSLGKSGIELEYDAAMKEAVSKVNEANKVLSDKRAELLSKQAKQEDLDRVLQQFENDVQVAVKDLENLRKQKGAVQTAVKDQTSLFDTLATNKIKENGRIEQEVSGVLGEESGTNKRSKKNTGTNRTNKSGENEGEQRSDRTDTTDRRTKRIDSSESTEQASSTSTEQARKKSLVNERIVPEKTPQPTSGGKKLNQIIKDVADGLEATLIYANPGGKNTAGTYNPSNTLIKIKNAGDLDTSAHEIGHLIDDRYDLLGNKPKGSVVKGRIKDAIDKELKWYADRGGSNPPAALDSAGKKAYLQREGFGEFIRAYIANPKEAKKVSPELLDYFESAIDAKTMAELKKFSKDYIDFANSTAGEQVLANIEGLNEEKGSAIKDWLMSFSKDKDKFSVGPFDKLKAQMVNSMEIPNKAFEFILENKSTSNILPEKNFETMSRLFAGVNGKVTRILDDGLVNAKNEYLKSSSGENMNLKWLFDKLDNTSVKSIQAEMEDVVKLLVAERTMEYAAKFGRSNDLTGVGGGIKNDLEVANEHLGELAQLKSVNPEKYSRLLESAARYREYADAGLRYAVDKGRLSEEKYQEIKSDNQYYVSLARVKEVSPTEEPLEFINKYAKGGLTSVKDVFKKAKGGTGTIQNPYLSLIKNTVDIIREADRNEVMRTFVEPLTSIRAMGNGAPVDFSAIARKVAPGEKNAKSVYIKGEKQTWQFQDDIYEALTGMGGVAPNMIINAFAVPGNVLRWTVTHSPFFAAKNVVRDTFSRVILSRAGSGIKDLVHDMKDKELFDLYGGSQAGYHLINKSEYAKQLKNTLEEIAKSGKGYVLDPRNITKGWDWYEKILAKGENINRVAEFKAAYRKGKENGLDDYNAGLQAAFEARDTLDFAVAGHTMRTINRLIPFSNAGVQGLRRGALAIKENPAGFAMRTALYTVLPTLAIRALVHAMGDDDEYEQLPAYQRDLTWTFRTPFTGDKWISIPKPFDLGLTSSMVDRMISRTNGNDHALEDFHKSMLGVLIPFDEGSMAGPFRPIIENYVNKDFFKDTPIIPQWEERRLIHNREGRKYASNLGKGIAATMGLTGSEWEPRYIDHYIKSQFSYFGDWSLAASDLIKENPDSRNKFAWSKTGFVKDPAVANAQVVKDVYKLASELGLERSGAVKRLSSRVKAYYSIDSEDKRRAEVDALYRMALELRPRYEKMKADQMNSKDPKSEE